LRGYGQIKSEWDLGPRQIEGANCSKKIVPVGGGGESQNVFVANCENKRQR